MPILEDSDFKKFPTTRYQGSKRKITPWIYDVLKDIEFTTVLDACGGSGSVSYLFKKMGKHVTYNDQLKFNYLIGKALIQNQNIKLLDEDVKNLFDWTENNKSDNFIEKTFKNIYYLNKENKWLDAVNSGIINMNHYRGQTLEYKKSIAYYALFQASIIKRPFNLFHRKNLHLRTNDVERNFGNKTTWDKSFKDHFMGFINEANSVIFNSGTDCIALNQSIFEIENNPYDLIYIDPPYITKDGSNETSNYFKCYHFLEGLVNYEDWKNRIDYDSKNLRLSESELDNKFNKEKIKKSFEDIISRFRDSKIVISYKLGGIPSVPYIIDLMKKYKTHVSTKTIQYTYALNKQNGDHTKNKEVLIIGV